MLFALKIRKIGYKKKVCLKQYLLAGELPDKRNSDIRNQFCRQSRGLSWTRVLLYLLISAADGFQLSVKYGQPVIPTVILFFQTKLAEGQSHADSCLSTDMPLLARVGVVGVRVMVTLDDARFACIQAVCAKT